MKMFPAYKAAVTIVGYTRGIDVFRLIARPED